MSEQTEEKTGSGVVGAVAATAIGAGAGKLMLDKQTSNVIDAALKGEDAIYQAGGKKVEFASKLKDVASKPAAEGSAVSFVEKLTKAKDDLAKTGEAALKGEEKKLAKTASKEALKGIKAGMAEAKLPVWKNIPAGGYAKVAVVAIPAAIASKMALNAMFGGKHVARIEEQQNAPAAEPTR